MADEVDLRNIRATIARTKKGSRAEREKARAQLRWLEKDFPQYFHNGYFREPPKVQLPPIEEDEDWLLRVMARATDEALQQVVEAHETPSGKLLVNTHLCRSFRQAFDQAAEFAPGVLNDIGRHARKMLIERGEETRTKIAANRLIIAEEERDHEWEALEKATPFLDEYDRGPKNWRVSEIIKIHYCIIATRDEVLPGRGHKAAAKAMVTETLAEARRRYKAGFYANPLIDPPVPRPGVQLP